MLELFTTYLLCNTSTYCSHAFLSYGSEVQWVLVIHDISVVQHWHLQQPCFPITWKWGSVDVRVIHDISVVQHWHLRQLCFPIIWKWGSVGVGVGVIHDMSVVWHWHLLQPCFPIIWEGWKAMKFGGVVWPLRVTFFKYAFLLHAWLAYSGLSHWCTFSQGCTGLGRILIVGLGRLKGLLC